MREVVTYFAYLDAGTGSIIAQAIIGSFLGITVVMNRQIRTVFSKLTKNKKSELGGKLYESKDKE